MSDHPNPKNGWYEYQRLVLHELDRGEKERTAIENKIESGDKEIQAKMEAGHRDVLEKISAIHDDVIALKVKASMWGAAAGSGITIAMAILKWAAEQ